MFSRIRPLLLVLVLVSVANPALSSVRAGDEAPLFVSVDYNMQNIDMADLIDGTPLVYVQTSAT